MNFNLLFTAFTLLAANAFGSIRTSEVDMKNYIEGESFYMSQYSSNKDQKKFQDVLIHPASVRLEKNFEFSRNEQVCESDIIRDLDKNFGEDLVEHALILSRKQNLIDDVALDILLPLAKNLTKSQPKSDLTFKIKKGAKVLEEKYRKLFSRGTCLFDEYIALSEFLELQVADTDENYMTFFNDWARCRRIISRDQYRLLNSMATDFTETKSRLRLRDYLKKRKIIFSKRLDTEPSEHIVKREGKNTDYGKRYRLYKNFSLSEIEFLSNYIEQMNNRILGDRAEIIFYSSEEARAQEKEVISLGPMEQMRLALKIFSRDIKILSKKELYRGKDLSFRTMLALGFEVGKINSEDLDYLYGIPSLWDRKKSLGEKISNVINKYGFIVPIFTGPIGTYVYFLGLSIMNTTINRKKDKLNSEGDFEHDLFYGNCDLGGI